MEVSKLPLRDGDGLRHQAGVAVDLVPLAVQAGSRSVGDVIGEPVPDKSRRHNTKRQASYRGKCCARAKKMYFRNFAGTMGPNIPVETSSTRR